MNKGRILVIDDEYGIRMGVREVLEFEGYQVEAVETGRQALELIDSRDFDVILIDYRLPDIDGITLLQAIRRRQLTVTTCMITAYANIETAIAATREGIDTFLPKPFSPDDLTGVVKNLFRQRAIREEAERLRLLNEANLLALASEKSQTHSLVESLRDAVMVVNRAEEVVLANRAMTALLKSGDSDLLRLPVGEVLSNSPFASLAEALAERTAAGRAVFDIDVDDSQYMIGITPFFGGNGDELGYILTISDISEVRRLAIEKSRFMRMMIHELRSPLGAIKGVLEIIADRSLGNDVTSYLPFLERAEKRLNGLVDLIGVLLTLSQIEFEGRREATASLIDTDPMVEEVVELYRQQMKAAEIELSLHLEPGIKAMVDPEDLKTILTNLVGNAVKYNRPRGRVAIRVDRDGSMIRFQVEDTGLGIKAENVPRIFDDFFREKRSETREITGNGLGLAIVKRLVQRYSGEVSCVSEEGKGSIFTVRLSSGRSKSADTGSTIPAKTQDR